MDFELDEQQQEISKQEHNSCWCSAFRFRSPTSRKHLLHYKTPRKSRPMTSMTLRISFSKKTCRDDENSSKSTSPSGSWNASLLILFALSELLFVDLSAAFGTFYQQVLRESENSINSVKTNRLTHVTQSKYFALQSVIIAQNLMQLIQLTT